MRALVVEDNPITQTALSEYLSRHGVTADHAGNGDGALVRLALPPAPDAVITDELMPHMSGIEMLERMRQLPHMRAVPAVVITAMADGPELEEKRQRLAHLQPARLMRKPFEMSELLGTLREMMPGGL